LLRFASQTADAHVIAIGFNPIFKLARSNRAFLAVSWSTWDTPYTYVCTTPASTHADQNGYLKDTLGAQ
jgi:hypothetical protein